MNLYKRTILLLVLAVLFGGQWLPAHVNAQTADLPAASAGDLDICGNGAGPGAITGKVTRADSGLALDSIVVNVYTIFDVAMGSDLTDQEGVYTLNNLPGGTYVVSVEAGGALPPDL